MNNLLLLTDFSVSSAHACQYGYQLAAQLKANVILCNAIIIPAEMPQAGIIIWPMEESDLLLNDSKEELEKLKQQLMRSKFTEGFQPEITCVHQPGTVTDVVYSITSTQEIALTVMGSHHNDGLSTWMLGNHSRQLISDAIKPLLLIPPDAVFTPIKKIAFAIDSEHAKSDLDKLYKLITFAKALNAEVLIAHVHDSYDTTVEFRKWMEHFLTEVSNKANYPNIYYRVIHSESIEKGLKWLCEFGEIEVLAMHHHHHGFFGEMFSGSQAKKMASGSPVPLLVFSN